MVKPTIQQYMLPSSPLLPKHSFTSRDRSHCRKTECNAPCKSCIQPPGHSGPLPRNILRPRRGWPIPAVVPAVDIDGKPWENRSKAMGYRKSENSDDLESPAEYGSRVSGIMRVYFHILKIPPRQQPLKPMFQLPRYWIWFARLMGERGLLETAIAPQLIYSLCFCSLPPQCSLTVFHESCA